ncbi:hypothetical protein GCM10011390_36060 [Aureimonas endophytica]|uniref:GGDEF domain-containing protein n=1 Tax=Aureimonas endophytica TaxID=2027858 RepID=A0A916ZTZ3_9HYPH|nr:sensor domain-containing diguanylate cyclase [Aureimonas endophytica]GGE13725.1 hypothetical protein GCM10011390_36060 [Aureimonas endophytica]
MSRIVQIEQSRGHGMRPEADGPDRTEAALFASAMLHLPFGFAVYDAEDRLTFVNDSYVRHLGLPREDVRIGISFLDVIRVGRWFGLFEGMSDEEIVADRHRRLAAGAFGGDKQRPDGRRIRLQHVPLPGGGWMTTTEDVTEQRLAEDRIFHMALHDGLTGLGNRLMLQHRFDEACRRRSVEALLYVDLDGFKGVNDRYGHAVGDEVLRAAAVRMCDCVRETDFIARFGGDEFIILLARTERHDGLERVALRLLRALAKPFAIGDFDIDIGASIGSARFGAEEADLDAMMKRADEALYQAKTYGRGRHVTFERRSTPAPGRAAG